MNQYQGLKIIYDGHCLLNIENVSSLELLLFNIPKLCDDHTATGLHNAQL